MSAKKVQKKGGIKAPTPPQGPQDQAETLPFTRMNYILLLAGVGVIVFGFLLMSMDDFIDATEFSISLYIAPPIVVAGFIGIIYAIMYKPKAQVEEA